MAKQLTNESVGLEKLRQEPMMEHLLSSLKEGKDIGHYGRLVFVMVARHWTISSNTFAWIKIVTRPRLVCSSGRLTSTTTIRPNENALLNGWNSKASRSVPIPTIRIPAMSIKTWTFRRRSTITFRNISQRRWRAQKSAPETPAISLPLTHGRPILASAFCFHKLAKHSFSTERFSC